ncbi:MAG: hypothetical protein R3C16_05530 [Hyphomonadaceae bacterium]
MRERLADVETFEDRLNAARRFQREEAFRIGVQVLERTASGELAGAAYADLAEACTVAMAEAALAEVERSHDKQPGAFAVLALGKFGGRELAEGSDLDLMVVYDAPADAAGGKLTGGEFYTRVTQRLISALSASTEEGELYEIDTKLRPSGSQGPVAVRLSSFERYYGEEAWTWEMLALTRLRPVAGDAALGAKALDLAQAALRRPRDAAKTRVEVADMRALMDRERRAKSMWDLKLAPGGFVDIEFIAQTLQLINAAAKPDVLAANSGDALTRLSAAGALAAEQAARLTEAWALWSDLQQALRICVAGDFSEDAAGDPLKARLAALVGEPSFDVLKSKVAALQTAVRADFVQLVGPVGDGAKPQAR